MSYWAVLNLLFLCRLLKVIPAHKFVLAISSPVFFAMFYGQMMETKDSIELPDTTEKKLSTIPRYNEHDCFSANSLNRGFRYDEPSI